MNSSYDAKADALYLRFAEAAIVESEEILDGVILDFDKENRIVGIEFLAASKSLSEGAV